MFPLFHFLNRHTPKLGLAIHKLRYEFVSYFIDHEQVDITFLNYGYAYLDGSTIKLRPEDEINRHSIQLYHLVATGNGSLKGKHVLEIGCGRGGGSSYIASYLKPKTITAIDLADNAIEFCQQRHPLKHLNFLPGDAEDLQFKDHLYDAVINVESSHCYPLIDQFFSEVYRVLKPGGHFLYTDYRHSPEVDIWRQQLTAAGFTVLKDLEINPNVIAALDRDHTYKQKLIRQLPGFLRKPFGEFAGLKGSGLYNDLKHRYIQYRYFILQKPHLPESLQPRGQNPH
jgi:2-polyprenyl-3-methyl-5-hydroxy-6-metoxy-1,4-benzoquinol methylase